MGRRDNQKERGGAKEKKKERNKRINTMIGGDNTYKVRYSERVKCLIRHGCTQQQAERNCISAGVCITYCLPLCKIQSIHRGARYVERNGDKTRKGRDSKRSAAVTD